MTLGTLSIFIFVGGKFFANDLPFSKLYFLEGAS